MSVPIGSLTFHPLNVIEQSQDSLPVSCGGYTQTDKGIVVQVCEVPSQQKTGSMEGVQVPAVRKQMTLKVAKVVLL